MALQVFKFGGTSVGSSDALRLAAEHVAEAAPAVAVVVSAMSGVTDLLLVAAQEAKRGDARAVRDAVRRFRARHVDVVRDLASSRRRATALRTEIDRSTRELEAVCESVRVLRELTTRTEDAIVARGERLNARIFAMVLAERRLRAAYVDATEIVFTERRLGSLWPSFQRCEAAAKQIVRPLLEDGVVPVVPGFIGTGPDGEVVTLGRGGSDFSATLLARSIGARSVTLWKEVDGLMTADPRSVPDARVLGELHYREAAELAYYGAKVLHPRAMIPLLDRAIPLRVRNTFDSTQPGTRIAADVKAGAYPVKALTAVRGQALVSIEGGGMMGVPGIAGRTFSALAQAGHSVAMISQSSSEASICFVVPEAEAGRAVNVLSDAFEFELRHRLIDVVRAERDMALVAVVGLGMRGTPGIASRTFAALARESINVVAIAQGSSELNITVAIHGKDVARALTALHREYQLDRRRALATPRGREAALTLFGFGQIGRALARQLVAQSRYFRIDLGLELRCVALADRSGVKVDEKGIDGKALLALADRKETTGRIFSRRRVLDLEAISGEMRERLWPLPANRPVLVDLTAEETMPLLLEALDRGAHVVLANKKPLAVPQLEFDALFETARRRGVSVRYEATVGAGLPVLDTLAKLREAGDQVLSVSGCLSGTIGYILTEVESGVAFSRAVREAHALGYTEPDPRDDLSGVDVARKALILARTIGRRLDLKDVRVESLFPKSVSHADPATFMKNLAKLDAEFSRRADVARRAKKVLRYVARIRGNKISVALEAVPESSPIGRLRGTDNQIVFQTRRYRVHPLVVTGPGAGVEVTAAGVLNDLVAIATGEARAPADSRNGARRA